MPKLVEIKLDTYLPAKKVPFLAAGDIVKLDELTPPQFTTRYAVYFRQGIEAGKWHDVEHNEPSAKELNEHIQGRPHIVLQSGDTRTAVEPLTHHFYSEFPALLMPFKALEAKEIDAEGYVLVVHQNGTRIGEVGNVWTHELAREGHYAPKIIGTKLDLLRQLGPERTSAPTAEIVHSFLGKLQASAGQVPVPGWTDLHNTEAKEFGFAIRGKTDESIRDLEEHVIRLLARGSNSRASIPQHIEDVLRQGGREVREIVVDYLTTRGRVTERAMNLLERAVSPNWRAPVNDGPAGVA